MNARPLLAGALAALAAGGLIFAATEFAAARRAERDVATARRARDQWQTRLKEREEKARLAEQRAREAERDTSELLKAVDAVRAQRGGEPVAAKATDGPRAVEVSRTTIEPPGPPIPEAEKQRLEQHRAYQQELAKARAREAFDRAALAQKLRDATPEDKFLKTLERAEQLAATAQFQAALQVYNEAIALKPADLALPERARALQTQLTAQNSPVELTLLSDGSTFVSVANYRAPAQFTAETVKLLPGDYEIVGRRRGFRDVRLRVQLRADQPPPAVTICCTTASER